MNRTDWFEQIWLIIFYILFLIVVTIGFIWADDQKFQENDRVELILTVAKQYELSRDQAILLLGIWKHEAGRPGKEFGIESIPCEFKDGRKSFLVNCARACETIKVRCPNPNLQGVKKLGKRWARHKRWWFYVWRNMKEYRNLKYPE